MSRLTSTVGLSGVFLASLLVVTSCAAATPAGDSPSSPGSAPAATSTDATSPPAVDGSGDVLAGTGWTLESVSGRAKVDGTTVTLQFSKEGELFGSGGCNRFNGGYTLEGTALTVAPLATTLMACEKPVLEQETSYVAALQGATTIAVSGDQLRLSNGAGEEVLSFVAQSKELTGSAWAVTGFNDGNTGITSVLDGTVADVTFAEDDRLSGTGGCNRIIGKYTAADGVLTIEKLGTTAMACPDPAGVMEQEAALIKALESSTAYTLEGDELNLTTADGAIAVTLTRD